MKRISPERKASTLAKLLPLYNMTVSAVAQMEGILEATLYNWRNQAKTEGKPVPGADKNSEQWLVQARQAVIHHLLRKRGDDGFKEFLTKG
ncbi:hypothetical protein BIY29_18715 [Brenneria alni]|uniref:Transposase n=1 Tax=Brenneria alni TaxID=71656 RepID=A0A421DJ14_9GAMM|nr:transposase [Brenneria alni]RLM18039.1 hypothetical protein BIY29_18715 [Brenneria alni]